MFFCFKLGAMSLVAFCVSAAAAELPAKRVATVVRADTHSGRLVRAVVAPKPSPAPPRAEVSALVASIATRHQVEPLLVDSVIQVESNYNPYAISSKGAMGLMQLIPGTARRFGVSDTFQPEQNIEGGVRYLKYLMELYRGDEKLALAAYNAGEGAVAKYKGVPPYPETQNYVSQVGKRLDQSREAEKRAKAATPPAKPEIHVPAIEKTVDAEGREFYRTR